MRLLRSDIFWSTKTTGDSFKRQNWTKRVWWRECDLRFTAILVGRSVGRTDGLSQFETREGFTLK